ncbi:MAG: ATP-dependent Clp protease adapter ClpS [Gammaproteobacteria bacterium]|nr:ATP-dependent Clp protease adapter ClpS [Gammaproteobacteria bacterium]
MSDKEQHSHPDHNDGLALQEAEPKVRKPPLYKVVILNDDYTPMEFVVEVLQRFFSLSRDKATSVMLHVHTRGRGVAGIYTYEIAETKVVMVSDYAREHEHPLQCTLEETGD